MKTTRRRGTDLLNRLDELAWRAANKADEIRANPVRCHQAQLFENSVTFWRELHAAVANDWTLSPQQATALEWAATEKRRMTWGQS